MLREEIDNHNEQYIRSIVQDELNKSMKRIVSEILENISKNLILNRRE